MVALIQEERFVYTESAGVDMMNILMHGCYNT